MASRAKLKVYMTTGSLYHERAVRSLEGGPRTTYTYFVVALTKKDALDQTSAFVGAWVKEAAFKIAAGNDADALRAAGLLDADGTVLVVESNGVGSRPVLLMNSDWDPPVIGNLVHDNDRGRGAKKFEASMARYAGKGSIAAGAEMVAYNTGRPDGRRWATVWGHSWSDDELQRELDLGDMVIIRSGFQDWYRVGR